MVAYELYLNDKMNGCKLIGILPERRKDPKRITNESVLKWGRMILNNDSDNKDMFFKRITIDDVTHEIVEADMPSTIT